MAGKNEKPWVCREGSIIRYYRGVSHYMLKKQSEGVVKLALQPWSRQCVFHAWEMFELGMMTKRKDALRVVYSWNRLIWHGWVEDVKREVWQQKRHWRRTDKYMDGEGIGRENFEALMIWRKVHSWNSRKYHGCWRTLTIIAEAGYLWWRTSKKKKNSSQRHGRRFQTENASKARHRVLWWGIAAMDVDNLSRNEDLFCTLHQNNICRNRLTTIFAVCGNSKTHPIYKSKVWEKEKDAMQ